MDGGGARLRRRWACCTSASAATSRRPVPSLPFLVRSPLLAATMWLAVVTAFRLAVPGAGPRAWARWWPLVLARCAGVGVGRGGRRWCGHRSARWDRRCAAGRASARWRSSAPSRRCARWSLIQRAAPLEPRWTALLGVLAAGAAGALTSEMACPIHAADAHLPLARRAGRASSPRRRRRGLARRPAAPLSDAGRRTRPWRCPDSGRVAWRFCDRADMATRRRGASAASEARSRRTPKAGRARDWRRRSRRRSTTASISVRHAANERARRVVDVRRLGRDPVQLDDREVLAAASASRDAVAHVEAAEVEAVDRAARSRRRRLRAPACAARGRRGTRCPGSDCRRARAGTARPPPAPDRRRRDGRGTRRPAADSADAARSARSTRRAAVADHDRKTLVGDREQASARPSGCRT